MSSQRSSDGAQTPERKMSLPTTPERKMTQIFSLQDEDENAWWGTPTSSSTPTRASRGELGGEGICEQLAAERKAISELLAADMERWMQQRRLEVEAEKNSLVDAVRTELAEHLTQIIESCISKKLASSGSEMQMLSQDVEALRHRIDDTSVQRCRHTRAVRNDAPSFKAEPAVLTAPKAAMGDDADLARGGGVAEDAWAELAKLRRQLKATEDTNRTARVEADYALNNLEACQSQLARSRDEVRKLEACIDELREQQPKTQNAGRSRTSIDSSSHQGTTSTREFVVPAAVSQRNLAGTGSCKASDPACRDGMQVSQVGEPQIAS